MEKVPAVYMMSNKKDGVIYIGVTSDLPRRVAVHKSHEINGFSKRYNTDKLVWYRCYGTMEEAKKVFEQALEGWGTNVTSHERLKESYYIIQQMWAYGVDPDELWQTEDEASERHELNVSSYDPSIAGEAGSGAEGAETAEVSPQQMDGMQESDSL